MLRGCIFFVDGMCEAKNCKKIDAGYLPVEIRITFAILSEMRETREIETIPDLARDRCFMHGVKIFPLNRQAQVALRHPAN